MKKNIRLIVIIGFVLLTSLSALAVFFATNPSLNLFHLGKTLTDASSGNNAQDETVAIVYGVKISKKMLEQARLTNQKTNDESQANLEKNDQLSEKQKEYLKQKIKNKTDKELILNLVTNIIIKHEYEKLGIHVSKEEASAELDKAQSVLNNLLKNGDQTQKEAAQEAIDRENAYYDGLGYTEEQIRESQIEGYIQILSRKKFSDHFVSTLPQEKRKDNDHVKSEYTAYIKKLVDESDVQYFINLN